MFPEGVNSRKGKNTWSLLRLVSRMFIYCSFVWCHLLGGGSYLCAARGHSPCLFTLVYKICNFSFIWCHLLRGSYLGAARGHSPCLFTLVYKIYNFSFIWCHLLRGSYLCAARGRSPCLFTLFYKSLF